MTFGCAHLLIILSDRSFFAPDSTGDCSFDRQLDALEEFWDTENPRIGEPSAKGWKNYRQNTIEGSTAGSVSTINKPIAADSIEVWRHNESQSDKYLIQSKRTADMDEDDPFTTVLFSDIRPYLIPIKSAKGRYIFRLIWLTSLGLHVPGLTGYLSDMGLDDRWADTALANSKILRNLFPPREARHMITADSFAGVTIGREKKYKWSFDVLKQWNLEVIGPFDAFTIDGRGRMWDSSDSSEVHQDIARCIFHQLRMVDDGLDWDIWSLAFEASCGNMSK